MHPICAEVTEPLAQLAPRDQNAFRFGATEHDGPDDALGRFTAFSAIQDAKLRSPVDCLPQVSGLHRFVRVAEARLRARAWLRDERPQTGRHSGGDFGKNIARSRGEQPVAAPGDPLRAQGDRFQFGLVSISGGMSYPASSR